MERTKNRCFCIEMKEQKINSYDLFKEIKDFFESNNNYADIRVRKPYYIGHSSTGKEVKWFATKWYHCKVCGALWEFNYPDFPAQGFIRKFQNEKYLTTREVLMQNKNRRR